MDRRKLIQGLGAAFFLVAADTLAGTVARVRRRRRRRIRRRVRRRIRRRVFFRMVTGRRVLIVPVSAVAGWELLVDRQVVVVKEIRIVEKEGKTEEVLVASAAGGTVKEYAVVREDNKKNGADLEGSEISPDDKDTPGVESEIEEEVEEP